MRMTDARRREDGGAAAAAVAFERAVAAFATDANLWIDYLQFLVSSAHVYVQVSE